MAPAGSQSSKCPTRETLAYLILGQLPEEDLADLESHLGTCPPCVETLHSLRIEDTFISDIRIGGQLAPTHDEAIIEDLASRIKASNVSQFSGDALATRDQTAKRQFSALSSGLISVEGSDTDPEVFSFLNPPQMQDELGRLGTYRILSLLGVGGMGIVFLAEDLQLHRRVALKVMKPHLAARSDARKRFLREARAASAIVSDHIVTTHQVGEDRGLPFLAMALLQGESLETRLGREPQMPISEALRIARETAVGLAAAHEHGLLHRDIKPANIWLERMPGSDITRVKILDFGLARPETDDSSIVTQDGAIVGTPAYMAPEQAQGGALDNRCDLFSLGCVLYHATTGALPFKGSTPLETVLKVVRDPAVPPSTVNPEIPDDASNLITHLLAKLPGERPRSAREVIAAIATIENKLHAARETALEPGRLGSEAGSLIAIAKENATAHAEPLRKRVPTNQSKGRGRVILTIVAAVALLAVSWASALIYRIQTDHGTLIVEINDEAVEAKLKQNGLVIVDAKSGRQFAISAEGASKPRSGEYKLANGEGLRLFVVDDQGMAVETSEFKLVRNGQVRIRVAIESANESDVVTSDRSSPEPTADLNQPGEAYSPEHNESDFVQLFNGKDLMGWASDTNIEKFRVDPIEESIITSGDQPLNKDWLFTTRDYQNYVLRLEFMVDPSNDPLEVVRGNVALRGKWDNPKPRHAEVGIVIGNEKSASGLDDSNLSGTIVWAITGRKEANVKAPVRPAGEWNQVELIVVGARISVRINGVDVNDLDFASIDTTNYKDRPKIIENLNLRSGRIGISSARNIMRFRKIRVKELNEADSSIADRRAAEWALGRGAVLKILVPGSTITEVRDRAQLPPDQFQLHEVNFLHGSDFPPDEELANLQGCKALRLVLFESYGPGLGDEGLELLSRVDSLEDVHGNFGRVTGPALTAWSNHPRIKALGLYRARFDADDLSSIANIKRLEILIIQSSQVTAAGLSHLKRLSLLKHLALVSEDKVPDGIMDEAACKAISEIPSLEHLHVAADHIADSGVMHLATLPRLSELWLWEARNVSDSVIPAIAKMPKLASLVISESKCGDRNLAELANAVSLTSVELSGTTFVPEGIAALSSLRNIADLALSRTNLVDADLAALESLDNLRALHLSNTAVSDNGIVHLEKLTGLRELVLTDSQVSQTGLIQLKKALPECRIIPDVIDHSKGP